MSTKKIFIDLEKDVFPKVKRISELRSRLRDELTEQIVVTDSDLETMRGFFALFIAEFKDETGGVGRDKDFEDMIVIELSEDQDERNMSELQTVAVQAAVEYLLLKWYESIGKLNMIQQAQYLYDQLLNRWKYNSTRQKMVTPKYRPYW